MTDSGCFNLDQYIFWPDLGNRNFHHPNRLIDADHPDCFHFWVTVIQLILFDLI